LKSTQSFVALDQTVSEAMRLSKTDALGRDAQTQTFSNELKAIDPLTFGPDLSTTFWVILLKHNIDR